MDKFKIQHNTDLSKETLQDYLLTKKGETSIQNLGNMMNLIEEICLKEKPDKIIVFGDCDSTIAGAIVAKKLKIYLIHIEAGMRSYNKDMPEEINRLMTDHISDLLLCSTKDSVEKLKAAVGGFAKGNRYNVLIVPPAALVDKLAVPALLEAVVAVKAFLLVVSIK